jgi:GNAT superfamily N-acetyltransferase
LFGLAGGKPRIATNGYYGNGSIFRHPVAVYAHLRHGLSANTTAVSVYSRPMKPLFIRVAVPSEQLELEQLQWRASLGNAGDRDALLAHPDAIQLPAEQIANGRVFVSEWEGAIVGFAAVEPRADGDSDLDALFVDPHMQRRGIGQALVEHCAEFARQQGSLALHVIGNPHARTFYNGCGFEVIGTMETRFGPGLLMRKSVTAK